MLKIALLGQTLRPCDIHLSACASSQRFMPNEHSVKVCEVTYMNAHDVNRVASLRFKREPCHCAMYTDDCKIPNSDVHHPTFTQVYDVSKHPGVLDGSYSPERAMQEFMAGWDRDGDSKVSWLEFLDYYRDLSAGVEADDYFELMIRNCWHISGGKGWAENTSNTRVLVTHTDGRQAVHEVSDL
jgi:hypothetical protein